MTEIEIAFVVLLVLNVVIGILILLRSRKPAATEPDQRIDAILLRIAETNASSQAAISGIRDETITSSRSTREEVSNRVEALGSSIAGNLQAIGKSQGDRFDGFMSHLNETRTSNESQAKGMREELVGSFEKLGTGLTGRMGDQAVEQGRRLEAFATQLGEHRKAAGEDAKALREEVGATLTRLGARVSESLELAATKQSEGLASVSGVVTQLSEANERRQEALKLTVEAKLDAIRIENAAKLEEMRVTVDEKLQGTLEQRLGASFTTVNENLERVFKSVGEMQTIATGVGDLKRVLSNVKSRGTWGETTLGMLLEQIMTPEQYAQNVEVQPGSGHRVEYAIRLPGDGDEPIWLPVDAKLPTEDYERLAEASERGDAIAVEEAAKGIERAIRKAAADINAKYVRPPFTTDFGVMFLPTEGLFAEVVRRPGLIDHLQRECRVIVTGPTTLMALLTSLRMGFRSLAIQQRSSEVWKVLGGVKTEFGKFGEVLDKVQKKLAEAQNVVETANTRRRAVDKRLKAVEALPEAATQSTLAISADELLDDLEFAAAE